MYPMAYVHKIFCQYLSRIFPKSRFGYRTVQYVCFPRQIKGPHTYIHTLRLYYSAKGNLRKGIPISKAHLPLPFPPTSPPLQVLFSNHAEPLFFLWRKKLPAVAFFGPCMHAYTFLSLIRTHMHACSAIHSRREKTN